MSQQPIKIYVDTFLYGSERDPLEQAIRDALVARDWLMNMFTVVAGFTTATVTCRPTGEFTEFEYERSLREWTKNPTPGRHEFLIRHRRGSSGRRSSRGARVPASFASALSNALAELRGASSATSSASATAL